VTIDDENGWVEYECNENGYIEEEAESNRQGQSRELEES